MLKNYKKYLIDQNEKVEKDSFTTYVIQSNFFLTMKLLSLHGLFTCVAIQRFLPSFIGMKIKTLEHVVTLIK